MLVVGLILCCTGIGAIVGVPVALIGLAMPFIAPLVAVGTGLKRKLQGKCPSCDLLINIDSGAVRRTWVDCPGCRSRILIVNGQLIKPNPPRP